MKSGVRHDDDDDDDEDTLGSGSQHRVSFPPVHFNLCVSPIKDGGWKLDEPFGDLLLLVGSCLFASGKFWNTNLTLFFPFHD